MQDFENKIALIHDEFYYNEFPILRQLDIPIQVRVNVTDIYKLSSSLKVDKNIEFLMWTIDDKLYQIDAPKYTENLNKLIKQSGASLIELMNLHVNPETVSLLSADIEFTGFGCDFWSIPVLRKFVKFFIEKQVKITDQKKAIDLENLSKSMLISFADNTDKCWVEGISSLKFVETKFPVRKPNGDLQYNYAHLRRSLLANSAIWRVRFYNPFYKWTEWSIPVLGEYELSLKQRFKEEFWKIMEADFFNKELSTIFSKFSHICDDFDFDTDLLFQKKYTRFLSIINKCPIKPQTTIIKLLFVNLEKNPHGEML
jgi:hypothetical protein